MSSLSDMEPTIATTGTSTILKNKISLNQQSNKVTNTVKDRFKNISENRKLKVIVMVNWRNMP